MRFKSNCVMAIKVFRLKNSTKRKCSVKVIVWYELGLTRANSSLLEGKILGNGRSPWAPGNAYFP